MTDIKEILKKELSKKELDLVPKSFDTIGNILVFSDFPAKLKKKEKIIGEEILKKFRQIKTVAKKTGKYSGKFRTPKIKIIAGEKTKEALYKENNCMLKLDVEKCYFSIRLSNERKRICSLVKPNETILVMFSGVAPYPIVIAKNTKAKEVYGVEINPAAHKYALENLKLNKINNVNLFLGDVRKVLPNINKKFDNKEIRRIYGFQKPLVFDRILMPLPKDAEDFLDITLKKIKKKGIVHLYTFSELEKIDKITKNIQKKCKKSGKKIKILNTVKCGQYSPYVYRICVDFEVI